MNPFITIIQYHEEVANDIQEWHSKGLVSSNWALTNMRRLGLDALTAMIAAMKTQINSLGKFHSDDIDRAVSLRNTPGETLH